MVHFSFIQMRKLPSRQKVWIQKKYWNTGVTAPAKIALVRLFLFTASKKIGFFVSFLLYFWMLIRENHLVHLLTKDKENGITWKNKRVNIQETTTPHKHSWGSLWNYWEFWKYYVYCASKNKRQVKRKA